MTMSFILTEVIDHVGVITFNRPEVYNAMNYELLDELEQAVQSMDKDDAVSVIVLTGAGKGFMAGADLGCIRDVSVIEAKHWCNNMNRIFNKIDHASKPVIAAVNGAAMGGGCEISLACDIRIASTRAKFALPEVTLGITPGAGGTQRLSRLVGPGYAKEMAFTGRIVNAEEAKSIGLVNRVVEPEELLDAVMEIGRKIAANGQFAVRQAKLEIDRGLQMDVTNAVAFETESCVLCFATADCKEGISAFLEKRPAVFTDCRAPK
jgi:enoyl-CoA hydratase